MSSTATIAWLTRFQAGFSSVLRAPLDPGTGTLRADTAGYDPDTCAAVLPSARLSAPERLAVYNRQYWFRLFGVLQREYPLTAGLAGMWRFNGWVTGFLRAAPPRDHDLARAGDGFYDYLANALPNATTAGAEVPETHLAWLQACRIDAAFRSVASATEQPVFRPGAGDLERLAEARLLASGAFIMVDEDWPLVRLRRASVGAQAERPLPLPARHRDGTRTWALSRSDAGLHVLPLTALQAVLLRLLCAHSISESLALLEAECPPAEQANLPENVRGWLADSVRYGFWTGIQP